MTFNSESIVIKSTNYKDSDRIYTLYTRNKGRITAVGKGVRKISSKRGGVLDTSSHVDIKVSLTDIGFNYISEVSSKNSFISLKNDLDVSAKIFYVLELVYRLTEEEDPNPKIFDLLLNTLKLINSNLVPIDLAIGHFELLLMKHLGYSLRFDGCVSCDKLFDKNWEGYRINLVMGGLICNDCQNGFSISRQDASTLNMLEKGKLNNDNILSLETISLIKTFIQSILEDKFRTARVFSSL